MTQEVQPLTWSKRTNIEEHQQFFSKINEIIGNLAPTVDEAEQAIAQANAAIASANDAASTANAASAAASAAASQAQTAASAVAGYDSRLTAAEGDIAAIEGREPDYLKKAGATQTVTSQIMVPTTATSVRDTQIANGTRIQNDLDNYTPMVRTTGNQVISGIKQFTTKVEFSSVFDNKVSQNVETTSTWRRVYVNTVVNASNQMLLLAVTPMKPALIPDDYGLLMVGGTISSPVAKWIVKGLGINTANFVAVATVEGYLEVWVKNAGGNAGLSLIKLHETNWGLVDNKWTADISTTDPSFDPADTAKYSAYTVSS